MFYGGVEVKWTISPPPTISTLPQGGRSRPGLLQVETCICAAPGGVGDRNVHYTETILFAGVEEYPGPPTLFLQAVCSRCAFPVRPRDGSETQVL